MPSYPVFFVLELKNDEVIDFEKYWRIRKFISG